MLGCTRCGTELAYAGRPCTACLSPALFSVSDHRINDLTGTTRSCRPRLPQFALPAPLRGKHVRAPRGKRAIAALAIAGRWTWNSLAIAGVVHVILFVFAFLFQDNIRHAVEQIHRLTVEQTAAAPLPAPEREDALLPDALSTHDEVQMPQEIIDDLMADPGDPDFVPPEPTPFAPEPEVAPPRPSRAVPFRQLAPRANEGLGSGQPDPSTNRAPSGSGLLQNRKGDSRAAALKRHGGGQDTEDAVNLGLEYLSRKQSSDGSWDPNGGFDTPPRWATSDNGYRGATTALCVLPFLAAGNSPAEGRYADNVKRAINWLIRNQTSDGCVNYRGIMQMYGHTVATLALCEAWGMTREARIRIAAERAVRFLERTQATGGGWDYQGFISSPAGYIARNDLSISGWAVLALKSAKAVGIPVSERVLGGLADLYDRHSLDSGETYYADRAYGELSPTRRGIGMVGVGLASRVILDADKFHRRNAAAETMLLKEPMKWQDLLKPSFGPNNPNFTTFYGWYYGTLGIFLKNQGQGPAWEQWNKAMKETLLPNQVFVGARRGSWPAADSWIGPIMGDLYSTALSVLCLEVYYRYNPMHRPDTDIAPLAVHDADNTTPTKPVSPKPAAKLVKPVTIAGETLDLDKAVDRSKYLRLLAREQGMGAVGPIIDHLRDESPTVRTTALYELGKLKAKDAVEPVSQMLGRSENLDLRLTICDTLGKIGDKSAAQPLVKLLSDKDEIIVSAASRALARLAGGKDFGTNRHAWAEYFGVNP